MEGQGNFKNFDVGQSLRAVSRSKKQDGPGEQSHKQRKRIIAKTHGNAAHLERWCRRPSPSRESYDRITCHQQYAKGSHDRTHKNRPANK
jgi:hypothetical protein